MMNEKEKEMSEKRQRIPGWEEQLASTVQWVEVALLRLNGTVHAFVQEKLALESELMTKLVVAHGLSFAPKSKKDLEEASSAFRRACNEAYSLSMKVVMDEKASKNPLVKCGEPSVN
jgi:hypothetical protein